MKHGWKLLVLLIIAAVIFVWLIKAPLMSTYLSNKMKVSVSVGSISMWPKRTTIRNFKINNPHGFKLNAAFKADHTEIDYDFKRLTGAVSEIDQILIDGVYLGIECSTSDCSSNNWTAIGSKMPKEDKRVHEVLVHDLILTNMTVDIRGLGLLGKPTTKHFDRMEFREIDSRTGFPTKELINKIFQGAGMMQYIQDAFSLPQDAIEQFLNPLKKLGGENEEMKKDEG